LVGTTQEWSRKVLAFLTNSRLGWKGLPVASTLAYYKYSCITDVKSFIRLPPVVRNLQIFVLT
jgi:hypothetical protein